MDTDEIRQLLHSHASLRVPKFRRHAHGEEPPHSPGEMLTALEEYMADVAIARGDLEEALLYADHARHELEDQWNAIEGWHVHITGQASKATGPQVTEAKRKMSPDLYDSIREAKWLIERLRAQIRRLEKDEENTSRRYTILTGS